MNTLLQPVQLAPPSWLLAASACCLIVWSPVAHADAGSRSAGADAMASCEQKEGAMRTVLGPMPPDHLRRYLSASDDECAHKMPRRRLSKAEREELRNTIRAQSEVQRLPTGYFHQE